MFLILIFLPPVEILFSFERKKKEQSNFIIFWKKKEQSNKHVRAMFTEFLSREEINTQRIK